MTKFAAQMNTLRAYCTTQKALLNTLEKVAAMGFEGVELEYGMLKVADRELLARHLETLGMTVASIRSPFARTEFGMEDMICQAQVLKCENVGIGTVTTAQFNQGAAGYDRYFAQVEKITGQFRESGLRPVYSLRNHEFMRQNGQWIFDRLAGRMPLCRLTDQKIRENERYFFFPEREECPLGEGLFDLALWVDGARKAGVEWFVLGQDLCDRDPFTCLELSLSRAKTL